MDAKWSSERVRLELYALVDRRLVAIEAAISGPGTVAAVDVAVTPSGNLSSTNVQSALEELQNDIDSCCGGTGGTGNSYYPSGWG